MSLGDGEVVTPKSDSILPSITRRSLVYVAEHYLGLKVTQRPVKLAELKDFAECGLCGTAAVISPVGKVVDHGQEICFPQRYGGDGTGYQETVRHAYRNPDGRDRGSRGLDPQDCIIDEVKYRLYRKSCREPRRFLRLSAC